MKKPKKIFFFVFIFFLLINFNPKKINYFILTNPFKIKNVEITNNLYVDEFEILGQLKDIYDKNILFLQYDDISNLLINLDFIKSINVRKKFPNKIKIKIVEEKPIAILNHQGKNYFITESIKVVKFNKKFPFEKLPLVFGNTSADQFVSILNSLEKYNFQTKKIKEYYYFDLNRWDLLLKTGETIKLPYNNTIEAIKTAKQLLENNEFKKYIIIDLRIDDKVIVR